MVRSALLVSTSPSGSVVRRTAKRTLRVPAELPDTGARSGRLLKVSEEPAPAGAALGVDVPLTVIGLGAVAS